MSLSDVLVPQPIYSLEESNIPTKKQHSPIPYVGDVNEDVARTGPSSEKLPADTGHHVEEGDTIQ